MRTRLVGMVISFTMAGFLLLASCSKAPAPPATSGTSPKSTKPYGSLTIAIDFGSGVLDPQGDNGYMYQVMTSAFFDNLIRQSPDGSLVPNLAERWEISPDGKSHTFYLRKGVKFHDGSDLTGADVKFSIERVIAPGSLNNVAKSWSVAIESVDLKDDYTVVLRLKTPDFELLSDFESYGSVVMPKKYIEEKSLDVWRKTPVGSGPFKFVKYEPGIRLELEAMESHWRAVPQFKNITFVSVPEEATRVAMLKTGELDVATISNDSVAGIKAAGLRVMSFDAGARIYGAFYFDVDNPQNYPVGDKRVRKALLLAMDRKQMADKLFGGNGSPTLFHPIGPTEAFWDPNVLKLDPYDPEQAKRLVAEAGYPNGFDTRIYAISGSNALHLVNQALPGYWRQIGVRAQLEPIEYGAFFQLTYQQLNPKALNSFGPFTSGVKRGFGRVAAVIYSPESTKKFKDPGLEALMLRAISTADSGERKRLMLEATALVKDAYHTVGIVNVYEIVALSPKVGKATPYFGRFVPSMVETITHSD